MLCFSCISVHTASGAMENWAIGRMSNSRDTNSFSANSLPSVAIAGFNIISLGKGYSNDIFSLRKKQKNKCKSKQAEQRGINKILIEFIINQNLSSDFMISSCCCALRSVLCFSRLLLLFLAKHFGENKIMAGLVYSRYPPSITPPSISDHQQLFIDHSLDNSQYKLIKYVQQLKNFPFRKQ